VVAIILPMLDWIFASCLWWYYIIKHTSL
jgi:hypothetical protein